MKTPSTIRQSDIKVRKSLPSSVVCQRVFKSRKAYNRKRDRSTGGEW